MYIRTIINNHNIMKCPKCQTEVAEVYKFCPKCRTRLQPVESSQSNGLNSVLPPPTNNVASQASTQPAESPNNLFIFSKNKAIWQIEPGEVACRVNEQAFANLSQVSGLIISSGTTAVVYVDGKKVTELSAGTYEFVSQSEVDKLLEQQVSGFNIPSIWRATLLATITASNSGRLIS